MRTVSLFTFMGILAIGLVIPTSANDKKKEGIQIPAVKRGPEHKILEGMVGTWKAEVKFYMKPGDPPSESTGTMTRKMILDGNFLQESYKGSFADKPFSGMGVVGFDQIRKKYVTTWCDSMSTSIMSMQGTYDAEKKTLTSVGEDYGFDGKKMKARDVLTLVSDDKQTFEMYRQPEGAKGEMKVMEITFTRLKDKKK